MSETIALVGIACFIAAIVGGGLKLAQIEIPLIDSLPRQIMLAAAGVVIVILAVAGTGQQDDKTSSGSIDASTRSTPGGKAKPDVVTKPTRPSASPQVTIGAPPGYKVQQCTEWSGTATLPAGRALVLGVRNLDNDDPRTYFATVVRWSVAPGQGDWSRPLFFGDAGSIGQQYAVTPMVVAQSAVDAVRNKDDATTWAAKYSPPTAKVVKTVYVKRRADDGDC
jgi:hypothetical protein